MSKPRHPSDLALRIALLISRCPLASFYAEALQTGVVEKWSDGVMEKWSDGVME
jgi:hypothetical protein